MKNNLIVLDVDGVLIDYHEAYALAWQNAFGHRPAVRDPDGHHPYHYWDVPQLDLEGRNQLATKGFTEELWRSMPALPGALEACKMLRAAGYQLICVTAMNPVFEIARQQNLKQLGFDIDAVYAVGSALAGNPKKERLTALAPRAFVDDHLPYLQDLPETTERILIDVRPKNSPNYDVTLLPPHHRHASLLDFAIHWTQPSGNRLVSNTAAIKKRS